LYPSEPAASLRCLLLCLRVPSYACFIKKNRRETNRFHDKTTFFAPTPVPLNRFCSTIPRWKGLVIADILSPPSAKSIDTKKSYSCLKFWRRGRFFDQVDFSTRPTPSYSSRWCPIDLKFCARAPSTQPSLIPKFQPNRTRGTLFPTVYREYLRFHDGRKIDLFLKTCLWFT
jgi:hypothetical protein